MFHRAGGAFGEIAAGAGPDRLVVSSASLSLRGVTRRRRGRHDRIHHQRKRHTMDTNDVIESLAAKLDAADLTDAEIDLLRTLLAGTDDDAAGFAMGWSPMLGNAASAKGYLPGGVIVGNTLIDNAASNHGTLL
jgi:hypothetical protein